MVETCQTINLNHQKLWQTIKNFDDPIKQGLRPHIGASSPIIIIEGQFLQTFLHTLINKAP